MDATRERDRRALSDLAKLANATPPPPSSRPAIPPKPNADSSGLIDLQSLMASNPAWLDDALSKAKAGARPPMSAPHTLSPLATPLSAPTIETMETLAPPPRSRAGYWIATTIALAAIGGACAFGWHVRTESQRAAAALHAQPTTQAIAASEPTPPAQAATPSLTPTPAPTQPPSPTQTPSLTQTPPQTPSLATAAAPDDEAPTSKHHGKHGKHHGAASKGAASSGNIFAAAADAPAAAPEPAPAPAPVKAAKLPPPPKDDSPLGAALREAAGGAGGVPAAPAAAPIASPPPAAEAPKRAAPVDGRPDRPSPSMVMSALQAQLPAARACVASASGPSRVRVTFASEGNVSGVDVSGAAASDGAMSKCIKSSLGKAHVPPFAQPTYAATVNVRPE